MIRKKLKTYGHVTDKTPMKLTFSGWNCLGSDFYNDLWEDPRTGEAYTISQAAAILHDRNPRIVYEFGG